MISSIRVSNIEERENEGDIIIAMNTTFSDLTRLGRRFVSQYPTLHHPIDLGSVLSFKYDDTRYLHMIVCHKIGRGGWKNADMYLRFGMDYLWHSEPGRKFSIVQVGRGKVGRRDSADGAVMLSAMANSFLPVVLYVHDRKKTEAQAEVVDPPRLHAHRVWHPSYGEQFLVA